MGSIPHPYSRAYRPECGRLRLAHGPERPRSGRAYPTSGPVDGEALPATLRLPLQQPVCAKREVSKSTRPLRRRSGEAPASRHGALPGEVEREGKLAGLEHKAQPPRGSSTSIGRDRRGSRCDPRARAGAHDPWKGPRAPTANASGYEIRVLPHPITRTARRGSVAVEVVTVVEVAIAAGDERTARHSDGSDSRPRDEICGRPRLGARRLAQRRVATPSVCVKIL